MPSAPALHFKLLLALATPLGAYAHTPCHQREALIIEIESANGRAPFAYRFNGAPVSKDQIPNALGQYCARKTFVLMDERVPLTTFMFLDEVAANKVGAPFKEDSLFLFTLAPGSTRLMYYFDRHVMVRLSRDPGELLALVASKPDRNVLP
ncbi:MAG TPA: hypothetical protein VD865_11685 [Stenotrophomonas sp.]|nr:hypothetical protein [Stenotrophomonas sp.]